MLVGEVGDVSHEVGLVDTVGNLSNNNLIVSLTTLNLSLGTHHDTSTTSLIGIANTLQTIDIGSRGEVRTGDVLHQSLRVNIGVVNVGAATIDDLTQVMSRHIGSHTHGNTVTAVHQQVRHLRRHDGRLLKRVVEVRSHVNGLLVEVVHDVLTHLREAALRITHGSRRVAIDRTEVTLTVNQRIAHIPVLSHTDEGTIDRAVAVGVVLTKHLTDYARTFLIRLGRYVVDAHHTVENTAMNRLEAITDIREGTSHNHRHRIVDVRRLHLLLNVDFNNSVVVECLIHLYNLRFDFLQFDYFCCAEKRAVCV